MTTSAEGQRLAVGLLECLRTLDYWRQDNIAAAARSSLTMLAGAMPSAYFRDPRFPGVIS